MPGDLLDAALRVTPKVEGESPSGISGRDVALYQMEYQDGLSVAVLMLCAMRPVLVWPSTKAQAREYWRRESRPGMCRTIPTLLSF